MIPHELSSFIGVIPRCHQSFFKPFFKKLHVGDYIYQVLSSCFSSFFEILSYFQALRPGRKKLNLPAGCVERTEAQPFYRVTSSRSQMEVDFWRHIMMPLKSGLPSEVKTCI